MQGKPRQTKLPILHRGPGEAANHKAAFARTIPVAPVCSSRHVAVPLNAYKALFILGLSPLGIRVPLNKHAGRNSGGGGGGGATARGPNTSAAPALLLLFLGW